MKRPQGFGEPILYLDFDGVLHHENCLWHPRRGPYLQAPIGHRLFQHADELDELLRPYPSIKIVLSTSWVLQYRFSGAAKRLPAGLRERAIGATFHSQMDRHLFQQKTRAEQVLHDVERRRPASWLALDDQTEGWPLWAAENVLNTDPEAGISKAEIRTLLQSKIALLKDHLLPGVDGGA